MNLTGYMRYGNNLSMTQLLACEKHGADPGGGHFSFICAGVCGHRIGELTHPQTKAGQKTDPFSDY